MYSPLSTDPFSSPIIPKFRAFDISIVCGGGDDATAEFVSTVRAIRSARPKPPVPLPRGAAFFDFGRVSPYEAQFPIARDPQYREIRNFIVSVFRVFSDHYLPYTLCRRSIKAPAHLTLAIWKLLHRCGLINYRVAPETRPAPPVPSFDRWPQLIYGVNEKLYTDNQYRRRQHPRASVPIVASVPQFELLSKTYAGGADGADGAKAESYVGALMAFRGWTAHELQLLSDALKSCETWDAVAERVRTKTREECVEMAAELPISYTANVAVPANTVLEGGRVAAEVGDDVAVAERMALSQKDDMRVVYRAVQAVGNERAQAVLLGRATDMPEDAMQAAGILAMDRIARNTARMREMHKRRIIECLGMTVKVLKKSIRMKKEMIDEAQLNVCENRPSESELTSSDEKNWQSGNEEN